MLINEVSKLTGLTKKAIEYYTLRGFIKPSVLDNRYRDYSEDDIELLNRISVLRKLDMSTDEIRFILADKTNTALQTISIKKELAFQRDTAKKAILEELIQGIPYCDIRNKLIAIDHNKTISEKLLDAFPGYYGRLISLHFSRFLHEPIQTDMQQLAFDTILSFLDNTPPPDLPEELDTYLTETTNHLGTKQINTLLENTKQAIEDPEQFLIQNKEVLDCYLSFKQTDEYKNSAACKLMEVMKSFHSETGYYDIFLPAMKQLSSSYSEYCQQIEAANEAFLSKYPEAGT